MGYFTFTDASKALKYRKNGELHRSCIIQYDAPCYVVCPDGPILYEEAYDGYGHFAGQDIFELAADWNKNYLTKIFEMLHEALGDGFFGSNLEAIAKARQDNDPELQKLIDEAAKTAPYLQKEWKRTLGIAITQDAVATDIPYPIKITQKMSRKPYAELFASISTQ